MDEVVGPEDGVPTPIIDTSIARDRGLFSWIWATMRIKLVICIIVIFVFHFSILFRVNKFVYIFISTDRRRFVQFIF